MKSIERYKTKNWQPRNLIGFFLIAFGWTWFWWALFILIPAFWAYVACWETYKNIGRLTRGAVGSLMTGILLTILSLVFLLNLTGGLVWPILLITGGLAFLATALLRT